MQFAQVLKRAKPAAATPLDLNKNEMDDAVPGEHMHEDGKEEHDDKENVSFADWGVGKKSTNLQGCSTKCGLKQVHSLLLGGRFILFKPGAGFPCCVFACVFCVFLDV